TSGFIGGPISPNPGYFDGITIEVNTGMTELNVSSFTSFFDPITRTLYIGSNSDAIRNVRLLDLTGRALQIAAEVANASTARVDANALPTGVYFAQVITNVGDEVVRFVVP
ncbi:MAG TPA: T9SS type A sorting domain-containing protein, partial [Flavobacteriales bacterium]|nr:T9SS type A sorting domain-containing protein [Flavobacteriales bacterium]